jgi:hypothetical protein
LTLAQIAEAQRLAREWKLRQNDEALTNGGTPDQHIAWRWRPVIGDACLATKSGHSHKNMSNEVWSHMTKLPAIFDAKTQLPVSSHEKSLLQQARKLFDWGLFDTHYSTSGMLRSVIYVGASKHTDRTCGTRLSRMSQVERNLTRMVKPLRSAGQTSMISC